MKIDIDKNVVELTPENDQEIQQLSQLWDVVVDCVKYNKKLVPIGEFVPKQTDQARFAVEE